MGDPPPERRRLDERPDGRVEYLYRYRDGRPKWRFVYLDGQLHGVCQQWWPGGGLRSSIPRLHGQPHGVEVRFDPVGTLAGMLTWERGRLADDDVDRERFNKWIT